MKIKKLKIKLNKDNEYSDYRYFIPKSNNIKMTDGRDVDEAVQSLKDKIVNLKEQANYLISKAPLVKYAEGTSITITDCAEAPLRKFSIEGNSYQETREGYNKFNSDNLIGITPTSTGTSYIINEFDIDRSGIYTIVSNLEFYYNFKDSNDNTIMNGNTSSGIAKITITDDNINTIQKMMIFINEGSLNKTWTKLMLLKGEYTLDNSPEYEQYGESPSIEFEAPIESVGDNINLFNKDNATILNAYFTTSNTISSKSGSDTMIILPIEKNTTYAISKILELNSSGNVLRVGTTTEYPAYGVTLNQRVGSQGGTLTETMITTSDNDNYLVAFVHSNRTGNTYSQGEILASVKISKGTSTGAYSPYGQGSIGVYNVNKNFLNIDSGITSQGITTILNEDGSLSVSGTSTSTYANLTDFILCNLPIDTYIFSIDTILGSNIILRFYDVNKTTLSSYYIGTTTTKSSKISLTGEEAYYRLLMPTVNGTMYNFTTYPQLERGIEPSNYVAHQSQTKALYTQQPFRAIGDVKDRFVKQNGVWYEEHNINHLVFNGTEKWGLDTTKEITQVYKYYNPSLFPQNQVTILSNCFIDKVPGDNEGITVGYGQCYVAINKSTASTPDEFKAKLTELYDAGTPVYVDYVLVTPTLIPCTLEQVEVLDSLQSYDRITYYNVDKINNVQANMKLIYKQDINAILEEKGV